MKNGAYGKDVIHRTRIIEILVSERAKWLILVNSAHQFLGAVRVVKTNGFTRRASEILPMSAFKRYCWNILIDEVQVGIANRHVTVSHLNDLRLVDDGRLIDRILGWM